MKKTAGSAALRVKWSYKAIRQLADIIDYIDQHNSVASVSFQRKAVAAAQKLSSIPMATDPVGCLALAKW